MSMRLLVPLFATGLVCSVVLTTVPASAQDVPQDVPKESERAPERRPSLMTSEPLGSRRIGMAIGGGVAALLPFYGLEAGYGITDNVDIVGRFETVIGLLHYPTLGARWAFARARGWVFGIGGYAGYSFFGVASSQVNLSSSLSGTIDLTASRPITRSTDLAFGIANEIDFYRQRVVDGVSDGEAKVHWDALIGRAGIRTVLTRDLDGYLRFRLRLPEETFRNQAQAFLVIPAIEIGGTWTW
jgi:hypothetical protein